MTSSKSDDEIQGELLDLVGFHNFTLLGELLKRREAIKIYTLALYDTLKDEKNTV